jgi:CBS domain-containing protein
MPSVHDVLEHKGCKVYAIHPSVSVLNATMKMNRHKLGALVVMANEQVVGMFTERDVLRRVVGEQRDPATTHVGEVMSEHVICCTPDMDLDEVAAIMKQARVRHLPVCRAAGGSGDHGTEHEQVTGLLGLISIGDVNAEYANHQEATIEFLNGYIYGRV